MVTCPGPIFRWLLLADEINRATPKTQSAMLEAMAEKQVTVLGQAHLLTPEQHLSTREDSRVEPPFLVLATQNPIDQEGVYDLPEAQADRFMFKIRMPYPDGATLRRIIDKESGLPTVKPVAAEQPVAAEETALWRYGRVSRGIRAQQAPDAVVQHVINIVLATNGDFGEINRTDRDRLAAWRKDFLEYGAGPRAATALIVGAKTWACLFGEGMDQCVTSLAKVALPVLRHRLKLTID